MSFQAYLDNIEANTGLTPRQFIALAQQRGFGDPATKEPSQRPQLCRAFPQVESFHMAI